MLRNRDAKRKAQLRALLEQHPSRDKPEFVQLADNLSSIPDFSPAQVAAVIVFCWEMHETMRAGIAAHDAALVAAERQRILAIISRCADDAEKFERALPLAFESDITADDAIKILDAGGAAADSRPN